MKRLGLHFSMRADVITVGIVCLAVSNAAFFYWKSHASEPCAAKEPTIEITETYFIPVPQPPKVIVKLVPAPVKEKTGMWVEPSTPVQPDKGREPVKDSDHPVSLAKRVIPDSLHHTIEEMNPWLISANHSK